MCQDILDCKSSKITLCLISTDLSVSLLLFTINVGMCKYVNNYYFKFKILFKSSCLYWWVFKVHLKYSSVYNFILNLIYNLNFSFSKWNNIAFCYYVDLMVFPQVIFCTILSLWRLLYVLVYVPLLWLNNLIKSNTEMKEFIQLKSPDYGLSWNRAEGEGWG